MLPSNKADTVVFIDEIFNALFSIFLPFIYMGQTEPL